MIYLLNELEIWGYEKYVIYFENKKKIKQLKNKTKQVIPKIGRKILRNHSG